jgi:hypothetical protein
MQTVLAFEVRVKKKNGKINSFHFTANNIDHARRRGEKKGRIISIKEVKREKLIGSIQSMNLGEIISPRKMFGTVPMITENMTMSDFFSGNKNKDGGLHDKSGENTEAAYSGRDSSRSFDRRAKGDRRETQRSDSKEN